MFQPSRHCASLLCLNLRQVERQLHLREELVALLLLVQLKETHRVEDQPAREASDNVGRLRVLRPIERVRLELACVVLFPRAHQADPERFVDELRLRGVSAVTDGLWRELHTMRVEQLGNAVDERRLPGSVAARDDDQLAGRRLDGHVTRALVVGN
ncbi:hypothetical protein ACFPRL_27460 [Pseudoclavibacter helvolus]